VSIHTLDTRLGQPWLLLASLTGVVCLTNSSTELGREHYLCSTTPDKRLAETVLRKRKVEVAEGKYLDKQRPIVSTFDDLADAYSKWISPNLEAGTPARKRSWKSPDLFICHRPASGIFRREAADGYYPGPGGALSGLEKVNHLPA
jgi:hypothetical protein